MIYDPDPTESHESIPPTQAAYNPYEGLYSADKIPPLPPELPKKQNTTMIAACVFLLILAIVTGLIGYSVGSSNGQQQAQPTVTPVDMGATATAAYSSGYNDGNSSAQTGFNSQATAIATASYGSGVSDDYNSFDSWLSSIGTKCTKDANGYVTARFYKDSSGRWSYQCY